LNRPSGDSTLAVVRLLETGVSFHLARPKSFQRFGWLVVETHGAQALRLIVLMRNSHGFGQFPPLLLY